jgi:hypothetical protein
MGPREAQARDYGALIEVMQLEPDSGDPDALARQFFEMLARNFVLRGGEQRVGLVQLVRDAQDSIQNLQLAFAGMASASAARVRRLGRRGTYGDDARCPM